MSATTKAGTLLEQYQLLGAVIDTSWATRLDHKVIRHVIDRYYPKFGQGRVSLRYLEKAIGSGRRHIIESLRRITENGVINVVQKGIGTRPTEYSLNFNFGAKLPSGALENTTTSGALEDTPCGTPDDTTTAARGAPEDTESYLRNRSTDRSTINRTEGTPAVPAAPLVAGLTPAPADSALVPKKKPSGFEELWSVFPRKRERSKARAEYDKLSPDETLHAELVARAILLAGHYTATGAEKKYWKHMHNWIREERYLEDLPEPYENRKKPATAKMKEVSPSKAKEDPIRDTASGLSHGTPIGDHAVEIVGSHMPNEAWDAEHTMRFDFRIRTGKHSGKKFSHTFFLVCEDFDEQEAGQQYFSDLRKATGILEPNETSDLHGKTLRAIVSTGGRVRYEKGLALSQL